jgi:hypothetical protein
MAKLKDLIKENFSVVGGVVSTPSLNRGTSLTSIVEDMYGKKEEKVSAQQIQQSIREFTSFSKTLQKEENLKQIAEKLSVIANNAKSYTLSETEDWFDKVTVNRNMKELTNLSKSFGKIAQESQQLQQRLGGLYEDMGHVLGRYFEIEGDADKSDLVKIGLENPDEDDLPKGSELEEGDYEEFFQSALKKFGVKSPDELGDDEKKKKFFNYVDKNYKAKAEAKI